MRVLLRGNIGTLRSSFSFSTSGLIHGGLLALVVFGNATPAEKPRSLYDQVIRPGEKRIVWYRLQERLPEVRPPAAPRADSRPLRATRKFEQRIVAGPRDDARPPQIVWAPAPEVAAPKPAPLPNVLAVDAPAPLRKAFTPPPVKVAAAAKLPDADTQPTALPQGVA